MTTMAVSPSDVFDTWAQVYDEQPNPLIALEQRFLCRMLPDVSGLDVLDVGCGTGRWLQLLAPHHPASLVGVDASPQMLQRASAKLGTAATLASGKLRRFARPAMPPRISSSLPLSSAIWTDVDAFARELHRVARPGATVFLTDMHPDTAISCNWKRSFKANGTEEYLHTNSHSLQQITDAFQACGFELLTRIEPAFDSHEKTTFEQNGMLESYESSANLPAIYILQLRKQPLCSPPAQPAREL